MRPLEFNLSVHVEDARLVGAGGAVAARGGDGAVVKAAGRAGNAHNCSAAFASFVVPNLAARYALKVVLNVTKGHVRALFLKHGSCPALPADITEDGTCQELVRRRVAHHLRPLRRRGALAAVGGARVPNGLGIDIDRRAEGDWYVSVLSLDGEDAEYRLRAELIDPPAVDDSQVRQVGGAVPAAVDGRLRAPPPAAALPSAFRASLRRRAALALLRRRRPPSMPIRSSES